MTPTTSDGVPGFYQGLEAKLDASGTANDPYLQRLLHATEKALQTIHYYKTNFVLDLAHKHDDDDSKNQALTYYHSEEQGFLL